ncbi:MAG TPA: chloride channel protein [Vicinamibacterales bacterium]|nr:chloride channel protein [Vicinamibacterales bacterium]
MSGQTRDAAEELGDFTASPRLLAIATLAMVIGVVAAFVAKALLALIAFFTNLFFFHRLSFAGSSPADHALGWLVLFVPVAGALVIGLMARYGSDRIRGHGIPEAIEAILINGSRVQPKVAILKPLSSAISIGSGGPFGAEGPIIMTGGAIGSVIAQFFHLTSAERKTLLVAGAAAGMSATFAAPVAAVLLAVELLLFEWKPRSFVPVALASATALVVRRYILGVGPLFAVPAHPVFIGPLGVLGCVAAGLLAGALSAALTSAVYAAEDAFSHLPIHWMWWPAIGGVAIGVGGYFFPHALGVGYDTIAGLLRGDVSMRVIAGLLIVKGLMWSISLGSGTSGGVLAPLLLMGGALGGVEALALPDFGPGFWPLVSMGAILGGTMRSPFTGIVFLIELTHDVNMMLPLLVAVTVAHALTVLVLKRSILTEKIARRGYHLSREYAIDPLEILFVREVMRTNVVALPADAPPAKLQILRQNHSDLGQRLYPLVDREGRLTGVITRGEGVVHDNPTLALADEPLRVIVHRMAKTGLTRFPVIDRVDTRVLVGMVSLEDLLKARALNLDAEDRRERTMRVKIAFPFGLGSG